MKYRRLSAVLLALSLFFSLTACVGEDGPDASASPDVSPSGSVEETPVRLAFLNGPTGVGAAKLLSDIDAGTAAGSYSYEVAADNSEIVGMLSGPDPEVDIAAVATNVALNLYNKTDGGVRILALNTLGVLYVLEGGGGTDINSMRDLAGKTVCAVGQGANPEYVFNYLLEQNGMEPGTDVTIDWLTAEEVTQALLSGSAQAALLPVPAATAAIVKGGGEVRAALDLTEEWDALRTGSTLTMGCIVARTAFVEEHPDAVAAFLTEYAASIDYVNDNPDDAAALVASHGLAPSEAIARKAIPDCHLVCVTGADIQPSIDGYFAVLYQANPAAIGGSLPDDAFYYVP